MSKPIRVLVVDDHPIVREGIAAVIGGEQDMVVVALAATGSEATERFREHRPDVTLMDLQMPDMDGVAATLAIRAECSDAHVLVLTSYSGDVQALRALKAGASGYMLKSAIRKELVDGIRAVHRGQRCIPREIASELAAHVTDEALSPRELEVLKSVAAGSSNSRVARDLSISEETVKAHMKNILSKLDANDRTHAVTIAIRRGIIQV